MRTAAAILAVAICGPLSAQEIARRQVPNWSFEAGEEAPDAWTWRAAEGSDGEFEWLDDVSRDGDHSFRVAKIGAVGFTVLLSDFVEVEAGETYRVSARVWPFHNVRRGVYLMISQHTADSGDQQLPNTFGTVHLPLEAKRWQEVTAKVEVREGNSRIRVHCLQAFRASDVAWDAVTVVPAGEETEPEPRYEEPVPEELPPLEPAMARVAQRPRAAVEVTREHRRPRLFLDGTPTPWAWYVGPFHTPDDAHVADFRDAGVRVYLASLVLGRDVYGERGPWRGPDQFDFSEVDERLQRILRVDPEGYIIFYLACDAYREWGAENPDHVTQDQDGLPAIVDMHPKRWGGDPPEGRERYGPSLVSQKLREETADALRRLVAHVESSEAGKAVIGYHVAGYNDGQWFQWAQLAGDEVHLADYSPAAVASFRDWLRRRYDGDLAALRAAWNQPQVTFESAEPPGFERYWTEPSGLLDPARDGDIADWTRFYSEGPAETVMFLADVLKEATPRPIICGTYYEDITCNSSNHIALGRFLAGDAIDWFAGPAAYLIRMPGYQSAVRSVFGSVLHHGRTYLTEQDWRSWLSVPRTAAQNFAWGRAKTAPAHNAMVRRECGMALAFGTGTWWYDMSGGWFADDGIMRGIAEAIDAFQRDLSIEGMPGADMAVIVSEDSNHWVAPKDGGPFRYEGVKAQVEELNVGGVPYRVYLQSDLPTIPDHRLYIFANPYRISEAERAAIERLKSHGRTLVFMHAPGAVTDGDAAEAVSRITGIEVEALPDRPDLNARVIDGAHPLVTDLPAGIALPGTIREPAFAVTDAEATPLATYVGSEAVAAALREFDGWRSVYVCPPHLTADFANRLARLAGCWVAAEPGNAVYANEHFITVHAIFGGPETLTLARPSRVTDLTTGEVIAERTERIELELTRGETRWFALQPR
ncbi:MAG: beta-galactosidase [Armatimonadota bacterium]|nr:beta-galactosidase [Armatimonadota bacterium]